MVTVYTLFSLPRFLHCATYGSCSWCLGLAGAPMRCSQDSRLEHPAAPINSFSPSSPVPFSSPPSRAGHTPRPREVRFPLPFRRGGRWAHRTSFSRGGYGEGGSRQPGSDTRLRELALSGAPPAAAGFGVPPPPPRCLSPRPPERGKSNSEERSGATSRQRNGQAGCRHASLKEFPPSEPPPRCPPATANIWNWKISS